MAAVTIEPVQDEDLPAARHIAYRAFGTPVPGPFLAALARERRDRFRVAHDEAGHVRGFAVAARQPGAHSHLFLLAVDPDDHGRGIRRALLKDIENVLREDVEPSLVIDVPANDGATVRLFRGEGFRVAGAERDQMGREHLVFVKRLITGQAEPVEAPTSRK